MEDEEKLKWSTLLDIVARGLLLCYGIGYLIDTIYASVFGIYDLELIRTRALFSGVSFIFLAVVICLIFEAGEKFPYISAQWRLIYQVLERDDEIPKSLMLLIYCAAKLTVFVEILQLSILFLLTVYLPIDRLNGELSGGSVMQSLKDPHEKKILLLLAIQAACAFAIVAMSKNFFVKKPRIVASLTAILCLGYVILTSIIGQVPMSLALWLLALMVLVAAVKGYLRNEDSAKWRLGVLLTCLAAILIYARAIYPRMLPWFGGPPKATLLITCKNCSVGGKEVRLIEETAEGYYVVPFEGQSNNAIFIPRANVDEVKFGSSPFALMR